MSNPFESDEESIAGDDQDDQESVSGDPPKKLYYAPQLQEEEVKEYLMKGKYEYLKHKLTITEKCVSDCDKKNKKYEKLKERTRACCNICWWKGVTKTPEEMIEKNFVCSNCIKDTEKLKTELHRCGDKKTIDLKIKCCQWCLWWDWFHSQRVKMCKDVGKTLTYSR